MFNTRRPRFRDPRVRRAFNLAFDFEEMNKQIFAQYRRIASYLRAPSLPRRAWLQGQEKEILETVRDKVPAELFSKEYTNPAPATLRPCAPTCARPSACSARPATRCVTAGWSMPSPASRSPSNSRSKIRTRSALPCSTSRRSSAWAWR